MDGWMDGWMEDKRSRLRACGRANLRPKPSPRPKPLGRCVLLLRPLGDEGLRLYIQQVGRALRVAPGKVRAPHTHRRRPLLAHRAGWLVVSLLPHPHLHTDAHRRRAPTAPGTLRGA